MGERKVLNKYFPPDFDPKKLPSAGLSFARTIKITMMLPFSLCCLSCGHYMYQGKKFNSKKETAKGMDYLGIKRYRFIIRCEDCSNEITFLTDPKNQDYECESGATRNFSAWQEARREELNKTKKKEELEVLGKNEENPDAMKALEARTLESKLEMDKLNDLEKLKDLNATRAKLDPSKLLAQNESEELEQIKAEESEQLRLFMMKRHELFVKLNDNSLVNQTTAVNAKPLNNHISVRKRNLASPLVSSIENKTESEQVVKKPKSLFAEYEEETD